MHLIVDALSHIDNLHLHWIHIGDGPQKDTLITQAEQRLGSKKNIRFEFKGNMTNHALLEFYRDTTVDLFINTSSSEGIPVTMMEAQSFGIPIVGPAVGGVPEIVNPSCGRLFPVDATPEMISHAIREILTLPVDQYQSLRTNAIENWNMRFAADHNFPIFVAEILKL
jgi:glycosyltransferase involved in cell wall biosynthesis